jgi:glycosyltransferase involved in cell wall biosynthesis
MYFAGMNIDVYCYDDIENPRCGGGGAFRERAVHEHLAARHSIRYFTGNFPGAQPIDKINFRCRRIGCAGNYLLSRISFSLLATLRSLFSKADIITIEYSIYSPVLTFLLRPSRTIVLFFHVTGKQVFAKYGIFGVLPFIAEKLVLRIARNFITLTDSMAADLKERRRKVRAVAGYVNFDTSLLSKNDSDDRLVLCFGRIDIRMKGIDVLIDAFEKISPRFPGYRLMIAGRGKEADIEWLQRRAQASAFRERIHYLVNPSNARKKELLESATVVCMPSRFEGWNIVAIEAAACSKPTIGARIHGLVDSIRENETGLLAQPENSDDLAEKMAQLLEDPDLRKRLGAAGYAWAQHFTLDRVATIQENFYMQLYNEHGGRREEEGYAS